MDLICSVVILSVLQLGFSTGQLYEGDVCTASNGSQGTCKKPSECPTFLQELQHKRVPVVCSFQGHLPFVCCSGDNSTRSKRVPPRLAVYGGTDARMSEFPHLAAVGFTYRFKQYWLCGGTLISKRFVMTAAHCLENREEPKYGKAVVVRLGDLDLKDDSDDQNVQMIDVQRRIPHPEYKYPMKYNDIGLLELKRDVVFNNVVKPACLHKTYDVKESKGIVPGWGRTETPTPGQQKLKQVELDMHPIDQCAKVVSHINARILAAQLNKGLTDDSMICAGVLAGGKDSCSGDSGGPLQVAGSSAQCSAEVIGITSFAFGNCGRMDTPAIYTRVSNYASWVESTIA